MKHRMSRARRVVQASAASGREGLCKAFRRTNEHEGSVTVDVYTSKEHEVELAVGERREAGLAFVGLGQRVAERRKQCANPLDVTRLVFDQKNFFGHELKPIVAGNAGKSRRRRRQEQEADVRRQE